ncbi:MAG: hypothetical protein J6S67_21695 [Methanobrevibacter sp.]|nr:hypothetical protein [Methanobrevibacter sp.]
MTKIFGFNILRDWELEKLKNENWEKALKLFKIKQLYRIDTIWTPKPKCPHCDNDRKIEIRLPDGTKTKVRCSCASCQKTYEVRKVYDTLCYIIRKNDNVWISEGIGDCSYKFKIIYNEKQFDEVQYLDDCWFVNKKLADKALKLLEGKTR